MPFNTYCLAPQKTPVPASETNPQALEKRIKELEHLLEEVQLRSLAYSRIIELAEQEFKLPIRKKFYSK